MSKVIATIFFLHHGNTVTIKLGYTACQANTHSYKKKAARMITSVAVYASINIKLPISYVSCNCEVCVVIRFLCVEGTNAAEIHRQLCTMYGVDVMPSHTVREWVHHLHDEKCANVHDKEREGQLEEGTNRKHRTQCYTFSKTINV